jgi:hypothetical protein
MRHLASALVLALAGHAVAAEDPPAVDASAFTLTITQVKLSRSVSFINGDLAKGISDDQASLALSLGYGKVEVIDIARVTCDSAVTDAGEDLAGAEQDQASSRMMSKSYQRMMARSGMPPSMNLQLALRIPTKPAKVLSKVTGSVEVVCESAAGETIELSPASDWVGKKRDLPGSEAGFTLLSLDPLKYACDKAVTDGAVVKALEFLDPQGKELPDSGWSSSGNGKTSTVTRNGAKLPPTGAVRLVLTGKTTTVHVPIAFTDIPLQAPPRAASTPTHPKAQPQPQPQPPAEKPGKKTSDF